MKPSKVITWLSNGIAQINAPIVHDETIELPDSNWAGVWELVGFALVLTFLTLA